MEVKEIFCRANQDSSTGKIWPMLQSVGRGMQAPHPLIPSLTTASGISKLNSSAEQAQSIIKDCQATGLDCSSVCGSIFGGTQRSGQSRAPAAQTIHLTAYCFWLPTELGNKLTAFVASLAKTSYFLFPVPCSCGFITAAPLSPPLPTAKPAPAQHQRTSRAREGTGKAISLGEGEIKLGNPSNFGGDFKWRFLSPAFFRPQTSSLLSSRWCMGVCIPWASQQLFETFHTGEKIKIKNFVLKLSHPVNHSPQTWPIQAHE